MAQLDEETISKQLQRIITTQEILRDYVSNLKERMSTLEAMLGTQMVQIGQMQMRIDRVEAIARQSRKPGGEPDPLPGIH